MPSDYDATEFVDGDFESHKPSYSAPLAGADKSPRAPTREEVDSRVAEAHQKLADLKRAQEELERQRAALEETRRRQMEFQTGRQEMIQNLTRGVGLLEEAEFGARRDAEQMARALVELRDALSKLQAIHEEGWTKDSFNTELTRSLTAVENARMEWNSARLKFPVLSGPLPDAGASPAASAVSASPLADAQPRPTLPAWPRADLAAGRGGPGRPGDVDSDTDAPLNRLPSWRGLEKGQTRFPSVSGPSTTRSPSWSPKSSGSTRSFSAVHPSHAYVPRPCPTAAR